MVISDGILAVPWSRKFPELCSKPFRGRENNSEVRPWNKNRGKLSEFPSEPFSRRENNSEFRSVEQKKKQILGIPFRTIPRKRKQLRTQAVRIGFHQPG
jgi:hypothetical protein